MAWFTRERQWESGLRLERKPSNLRALKVINQTDGNIFWEITNRKVPMATYEELSRIFF